MTRVGAHVGSADPLAEAAVRGHPAVVEGAAAPG
jgi:hypothetical protein